MKRSKEISIALVVLGSLSLLYYGYFFIKGSKLFKTGRVFYAVYNNVAGLSIDDPVTIRGYRVGKVRDANFMVKEGSILLELEIANEELEIPFDSKAIIINTGLLGGKEVDIKLGISGNYLTPGDTITSGTEEDLLTSLSSSLEPFEKKALEAVGSIDSVMKLIQVVLNEGNRAQFAQGITRMNSTLNNLDSASSDLASMIKSEQSKLRSIINNLNSMSANLNQFSDSLNDLRLKESLSKANLAMDNVNRILLKIDQGEGTMGQLVNNDTLYQNLESASKALDILLKDLEAHPKRYVHFSIFGKKEKEEKTKSK